MISTEIWKNLVDSGQHSISSGFASQLIMSKPQTLIYTLWLLCFIHPKFCS